ncbi:MAG: threonine--tRNA ligase, partial [Synergistaceae bacterium]|nr:threonine--tRNA ligase [Synergistaceae bacterium]
MALYRGPDDKIFEIERAITPFELFKEWGIKNALAALVDGTPADLHVLLSSEGTVTPITPDSAEGLQVLRHSTSHLMAHAISNLYPGAKFGVGPSIRDGFYYDVLFPNPITDGDLPKIEAEMKRLSAEKIKIERVEIPSAEALEKFSGDQFKTELINDIGAESVSLYGQANFWDLCRGPHVPNTGYIKHFTLLSLAGAYWRGNE